MSGRIIIDDPMDRVVIVDRTRSGTMGAEISGLRVTRDPYTYAGGRLVVTIGEEGDDTRAHLFYGPKILALDLSRLDGPAPGPRRLSPDHDKRRARAKAARKARKRQRR